MEEIIKQALNEKDYARAIQLMEELHSAQRIHRQRSMIKSFQAPSQQERKEISDILWITVNPSPDVTFEEFRKYTEKCFMKKWITSYIYVYEQRGQSLEELGKGFHLHALIKKPEDKSRAHCIREIASSFRKCTDISNYHFYNTKWLDTEEYLRKIKYIVGDKVSTEDNNKALKQEMDVQWRLVRRLEQYYYLNIEIGDTERNAQTPQETQ